MKSKFLATTAMVLIGLSGAAWAQQTTPTGKPDQAVETTTQEQTLGGTATNQPLPGEDAETADTAGTEAPAADSDPAAEATDTADTTEPAMDTTEPTTDTATEIGSEWLRSYSSSTETESITGSVAGGLSADTLIGMSVVDSDGESVGEVSDLIIGSDDVVKHAIVEVGGFLGFGAKTTAIDLEHATVDESKGEVVLGISRVEIDVMSAYQRGHNGWFSG